MCGFIRTCLKFGLGLAAAAVLIIGLQPSPVAAEAIQAGGFLLAQNPEPKQEKPPSPTPAPAKPGQSKMAPVPRAKKKMGGSMMRKVTPEEPAAAGTRKMGGQTLRDKETPESE